VLGGLGDEGKNGARLKILVLSLGCISTSIPRTVRWGSADRPSPNALSRHPSGVGATPANGSSRDAFSPRMNHRDRPRFRTMTDVARRVSAPPGSGEIELTQAENDLASPAAIEAGHVVRWVLSEMIRPSRSIPSAIRSGVSFEKASRSALIPPPSTKNGRPGT
jgi:hypothetical protein